MKIGTKSVLFGAHQFIIHPIFVAIAWWRLYGLPLDPRLWLSFFLHDMGYIGMPNIDGPEGEQHPYFAARIMGRMFGSIWFDFCLFHSRFMAKRHRKQFSRLCVADKLSVVLEPWWLYLPRVILSGEINEYMALSKKRSNKYFGINDSTDNRRKWFASVQCYLQGWVDCHRFRHVDLWTPDSDIKQAYDDTGVYR